MNTNQRLNIDTLESLHRSILRHPTEFILAPPHSVSSSSYRNLGSSGHTSVENLREAKRRRATRIHGKSNRTKFKKHSTRLCSLPHISQTSTDLISFNSSHPVVKFKYPVQTNMPPWSGHCLDIGAMQLPSRSVLPYFPHFISRSYTNLRCSRGSSFSSFTDSPLIMEESERIGTTPINDEICQVTPISCNYSHSSTNQDKKSRDCSHTCIREAITVFCGSFKKLAFRRMSNENLFFLSVIQILCGLASIILSGVSITKFVFLYNIATGLWVGCLMLTTGFHGILTSRYYSVKTVKSFLIFCVLVVLASCFLSCVSIAGLIEDGLLRPEVKFSVSTHVDPPVADHTKFFFRTGDFHSNTRFQFPMITTDKIIFSRQRLAFESYTSRVQQVLLHILLLVVGILETSVSIACTVLCSKQIFPSSEPAGPLVKYFRKRGAILVNGGNEFFLVVAAGNDHKISNLLDYKIMPPDLHPSVQPFLPHSHGNFVILTQAETGIHALVAAQTVANYINTHNSDIAIVDSFTSNYSSFHPTNSCYPRYSIIYRKWRKPFLFWRRRRSRCIKQKKETEFLAARVNSNLCDLTNNDDFPRCKTSLIYVLSSPSPNEPPMLFPPFPPSYSRHRTKPRKSLFGNFAASQISSHYFQTNQSTCNPRLIVPSRNTVDDHFPSFPSRGANGLRSHRLSAFRRNSLFQNIHSFWNRPRSTVPLVGDRVLQPVLIIEESEKTENAPPIYAAFSQSDSQA